MYVRMYVCMYVCMYACMHVCMYVCIYVCIYVCTYVCMYVVFMALSSRPVMFCCQDFDKSPEGGCKLPCGTRLDTCGHVCELMCHGYDRDHKQYKLVPDLKVENSLLALCHGIVHIRGKHSVTTSNTTSQIFFV